jgi:magnesium transporter
VGEPLHDQLVNEMAALEAAETRSLEQYPPDTAGGIMTTNVTALAEDLTVEQAIAELRRISEELEQMFYVYVVDRRRHLVGVLSMRDLILARPARRLNEIMIPNIKSLPATMDQEEVARLFDRYGYMAMPVVDARNRLIGLVTVDDVVDVLQEEATEDVQKMFGAGAEERLSSRWQFSFRMRVWWLVVNLGTAFLAGAVVGAFEDTLKSLTLLAIYMPIVAGMGGNAGAQAMAVSIRGLAVGKVDRNLLRHVILRELIVGLATGVVVGVITAAVALGWHHSPWLGLVVGLALIVNHTLACTSGAAIPFIMKKLGFDPAQSATIFATTVTDVGGFFGLFMLAKLFMPRLIGSP